MKKNNLMINFDQMINLTINLMINLMINLN